MGSSRLEDAPAVGRTLPAEAYRDASTWELERQRIFAREWCLIAHESQLARAGDARAETLAGWPILVLRGRDGRLRGFHNVCRHRAGPLVWEGESRCERLRCRYHGWLYDDEGRLERATDFGSEAVDEDGTALALFPIRVESWRGLVFVNLDPEAPPVAERFRALEESVSGLDLEGYGLHAAVQHRMRCNWKTYAENYLEGYHLPWLHASLQREVDGRSYRVLVHGDGRAITHHVERRDDVRCGVYGGLWAWLAPNAALNVYEQGLSLERMRPLGPGETLIDYTFLFREAAPATVREAALAMCARVTDEDRRVCEAVQANLEAGVYRTGPLSPVHENGVGAFQRWWRGSVGRT